MERRIKPTTEDEDDSIPKLWEDRSITRAGWVKHRDCLMANSNPGIRPEGWWLYERNMEMPSNQYRALYEMGELKGGELQQCLNWFRLDYDEAQRFAPDRTKYPRWDLIPPALVKHWDAERDE